MENRRPRPTRFEADNHEARLAHLREQAPTLVSTRRLRMYALFGSLLLVLTVAAFYFTLQIYKAASENREDAARIEVDSAPLLNDSETEKVLSRLEAEEAAEEQAYREALEALKRIDLLEADREEAPPVP